MRLRQLLRLALLVVEAMVALRIVLKVTGANAQAGFSSFVYRVSSPFVEPFHPVFADQSVNQHPFEVGSLLAMVVYAALAYLAVRVVRIILSPRA
ncbi:MAG: YggT family protein [Candidatus Dormibacteraeota bacterium]|uniref:YggT family protein n=1 Tax=Candidatus Amunia macphersoniae TaxID=3127014 RepID=A0A934NER1_9BACT|nr:YggT family protein [Candidatus Dormibacteraeota bacterium]